MRIIAQLACKDLRLLMRDRMSLFWVLAFPLIFGLFFGAIMRVTVLRGEPSFALAVVDESGDINANRVVVALEEDPQISVVRLGLPDAEMSCRRGDSLAYVHFPPGFMLADRDSTAMRIGIDPARTGELPLVRGALDQVIARAVNYQTERPPMELVSVTEHQTSSWDLVLPAAILWGLMGCAASFAISMVAERVRGTLVRLQIAPIGAGSIMASKALACFVACAGVAALIVVLSLIGLGVSVTSPPMLIVSIASVAFCFVGLTMLLGMTGRSEQSVAGAGWGSLVLMAMLGGAMVPVAFMPEWLRQASALSPVRWGMLVLEGALWRGASWSQVLGLCGLLVAVGAVAFAIAALRLRPTTA